MRLEVLDLSVRKRTLAKRAARRPVIPGLPRLQTEALGYGFFNDVWAVSDQLVVKLARSCGPLRQPLSWLRRNRREHEMIVPYLRVPPTYHVRLRDECGKPVSVMLQQRLYGELLSRVQDEDLYGCRARKEMEDVVYGLKKCCDELGWLPDVIGGPPRWGMNDVRQSNNLLLDETGRIWLIDPAAFFFWFSSRNPLGRLYTRVLLQSARRLLCKTAPTHDRDRGGRWG